MSAGLGSLLGGIAGGVMNIFGSNQQNSAAAAQTAQMENFQEQMSNTQYQRGVVDMRAAGLNPDAMEATGAAAATSPTGGVAPVVNALSGAGQTISSASQAAAQQEQQQKVNDSNIAVNEATSNAQMAKAYADGATSERLEGSKYDFLRQQSAQADEAEASAKSAAAKAAVDQANVSAGVKAGKFSDDWSNFDNYMKRFGGPLSNSAKAVMGLGY